MALLGLPPIPPQLKPLIPYLQRADELKVQDPIIAYWCAYHAAQIGISLKVKEPAARHFLFELLGTLEHMKKEIGPNDAIEEESASSAYVENFALKVFAIADNEDRAGRATRATAKKFLAAANFLEVLSVFGPSSGTSVASDSTNAEKILYAKWKAADIAKAYREGRKPTPGPANAVEELPPPDAFEPVVPLMPSTPPPSVPSGTSGSPPSIVRSTPPPPHLTNIPSSGFSGSPPRSGNHLLPGGLTHVDLKSPGSWSTMATPGTPDRRFEDDIQPSKRTAFVSDADEEEAPSVAPLPTGTGGVSPTLSSRSIDTTDTEGRKVRFSPSVTAGLSSAMTTPSVDEPFNVHVIVNPPEANVPSAPSAPPTEAFPSGFMPTSIYPSAPSAPPPPHSYAPPPPPSQPAHTYVSPPPPSQQHYAPTTIPNIPQLPQQATVTPVELTPLVIAKTQKHCRFAISALDYEDAETARKELRAALALLGG